MESWKDKLEEKSPLSSRLSKSYSEEDVGETEVLASPHFILMKIKNTFYNSTLDSERSFLSNTYRKLRTILKLRNYIGFRLKRYNIIFLKNLRAAGDSIQLTINKNFGGFTGDSFSLIDKETCNFFMVCRNPYTKLLSNYYHYLETSSSKMYKIKDNNISFEEFIKTQCHLDDEERNDHTKLQYRFLKYNPSIIRFENLKEDWKEFCMKNFGKHFPLEHKHKSKKFLDDKSLWTEELIDLVYKSYKIDFDNFGYNKMEISKNETQ